MTDQEMLEAIRAVDGVETIDDAITYLAESVGNAEAEFSRSVVAVLQESCIAADAESVRQALRLCGAPELLLKFFGAENQNPFTLDKLLEDILRQAACETA